MTLRDQVAVIAGATGRIGQAIAIEVARQGAKLALTGRNPAKLQLLANNMGKSVAGIRCYHADLTRENEVERLSNDVLRDFGKVDILVHSAGIASLGRIGQAPSEELDSQYAANVRAPYLLTKALLESLKKQKGQIVFINSTAGLQSRANLAQYAATKHALAAIANSLRDEVNPDGVRVLSVFLGRTATPMQAEIYRAEGREYRPELLLQPEDIASLVVSALVLPRTAEVTEIKMRPLAKSY
jgi:short-subunit dehydrogenase